MYKLRHLPWRKIVVLGVLATILLTALHGYISVTSAYVCSECGKHELRRSHILAVPFNGPFLWTSKGEVLPTAWFRDHLVKYLDPEGSCSHRWVGYGSNATSLAGRLRGIGVDPAMSPAAWEPDFGKFMEDHPEMHERIRESLRERAYLNPWLYQEYFAWKEDKARGTP